MVVAALWRVSVTLALLSPSSLTAAEQRADDGKAQSSIIASHNVLYAIEGRIPAHARPS